MLLWLRNGSFFPKTCCCNQQTGGVPLPFVHSGDIILAFTHNTNGFLMILGGPAGGNTGPRGNSGQRGCPSSRVHSTKSRGWESWGSKSQVPREAKGKREEGTGKNDFLLRLVAPGGPADISMICEDKNSISITSLQGTSGGFCRRAE